MSAFDYGHKKANGQYERYPSSVLVDDDGKPVFAQPIRNTYYHRTCGTITTMPSEDLCLTYATNPSFYGRTFCVYCRDHLPLDQFVWEPDSAPMTEVYGTPGQDLRMPIRGRDVGHFKVWDVYDEGRTVETGPQTGDGQAETRQDQ